MCVTNTLRLLPFLLPVLLLGRPSLETAPTFRAFVDTLTPGTFVFEAKGTGSMRPYIHGREQVVCDFYRGQPIHKGDWIVFARWDKLIFHEVTDVSKTHFKTQGTNCIDSDGWYPFIRCKYIARRVVTITTHEKH